MLSPVALLCPQCAAPLPRAARWRTVECAYCHATILRGEETVARADFRAAWLRARSLPSGGQRQVEWRGGRYAMLAPLGHGDHSEVWLAERRGAMPERVTLKLAREDGGRGALVREHAVLQALQALDGPGAAYFTRRLPQAIGTGRAQGLEDGARDALLLRHPPGYWGSLADVVRALPDDGIDPRHAVWLWRRMLEVLGFVHTHHWSHGEVSPAHALVHPRDHGVLLIGWGEARQGSGPAHAARAARDLQQAAWTVRAVLHGRQAGTPGVGRHTPEPLAALLRRCSESASADAPQGAAATEAALTTASRAAFGMPRFVPFDPDPAPAGA